MMLVDLHDISLETHRTIALGTVALGQTLFVVLYATFPWFKSFLGRALFIKALMLAVIMDLFIVSRVWQFGNRDAIFVTFYYLLAVGVWFQFLAFLRVRAHGRQDPERNDAEDARISRDAEHDTRQDTGYE